MIKDTSKAFMCSHPCKNEMVDVIKYEGVNVEQFSTVCIKCGYVFNVSFWCTKCRAARFTKSFQIARHIIEKHNTT